MKTNLLKFKWYIIGFILIAIMLSVSLSFASWDTASLKAKLANNGSGKYYDMYKIVEDANKNNVADVGDVVEYGNYYQESATTKSPLKWIVVDKTTNTTTKKAELTLMSKYVIAHGSFFGGVYATGAGWDKRLNSISNYINSQNYSTSTVRAWLNLDGSDKYVRSDFGTPLTLDSADGVAFQGFYNHAFNAKEKTNIIPKTISGMRGSIDVPAKSEVSGYEDYASVTDKVWLASYSEVYGSNYAWGECSDGVPNKQFEYFKSGNSKVATTTAFASSNLSNYAVKGIQPEWTGNWNDTVSGDATFWMTRSSVSNDFRRIMFLDKSGKLAPGYWAVDSVFGVRPAIIVPA